MRALIVSIYIITMFYFLFRGFYYISGSMLLLGIIFILCLPVHKKRSIENAKKRIVNALRKKSKGETIKPFIEVNSSPWYVLAELPGISIEMAKQAVEIRKHNGKFPSINVFIALTHVKQIYVEHIKAVAYVTKEMPPINQANDEKADDK